MTYDKINSLFKRGEYGLIIPSNYSESEFAFFATYSWECTEKIDGTNTRIELSRDSLGDKFKIKFGGKTDKEVIQSNVIELMNSKFKNIDYESIFTKAYSVTIFGEAYGEKIQSVGSRYIKNGNNFIIFDIRIGNYWLLRKDIKDIAKKMNADVVPLIGYYDLRDAITIVAEGFKSRISEDKTLNAEGLVLKTPLGLLDRNGNRIITKLKTSDFRKYENKYGYNIDWSKIKI